MKQGREDSQVSIAQRMLQKNMALADIADLTGLAIEVLQSLPRMSRQAKVIPI